MSKYVELTALDDSFKTFINTENGEIHYEEYELGIEVICPYCCTVSIILTQHLPDTCFNCGGWLR